MTRMCTRKLCAGLLTLSLLLSSPFLMALPTDKNLPLKVIADTVAVDYTQGITTLNGNVVVTQGSTELQGNKVIVYTDKNQKLIKLVAYGNATEPARYKTLPAPKSDFFIATANTITYIELDRLAIFEGDAHATDGVNQFQGPNFKYWTDKQEVVTEKTENQRSTIIIFPHSGKSSNDS